MDLFGEKLQSALQGLISESRSLKKGYATVVDCLGISSDWTLGVWYDDTT